MESNMKHDTKHKKLITSLAIGGIAGFIASLALMRTIQTGFLGDLGVSRSFAALAGVMYILCGGFVGLGVLLPKVGAKFLNVEDADELKEQSPMLRNSVFGIAAFGLCLILLALAAPIGPLSAPLVGGSILVLMVAASVSSLSTLKAMDELSASLSRETAVASFYTLFLIGGGWSVLAHLEYAPALGALDWLTMFAASMLFGAFWASGRRGLLMPR